MAGAAPFAELGGRAAIVTGAAQGDASTEAAVFSEDGEQSSGRSSHREHPACAASDAAVSALEARVLFVSALAVGQKAVRHGTANRC